MKKQLLSAFSYNQHKMLGNIGKIDNPGSCKCLITMEILRVLIFVNIVFQTSYRVFHFVIVFENGINLNRYVVKWNASIAIR